jgi:hypothetical protein
LGWGVGVVDDVSTLTLTHYFLFLEAF